MLKKITSSQNILRIIAFAGFVVLVALIGAHILFSSKAANVAGDLNNDGNVDIIDLSTLLSHWDEAGAGNPQDINQNGLVDIYDLSILLKNYGNSAPGPSAPANASLPTISGSVVQGKQLTATNGTWLNSPTSYSYQWQDCDPVGGSCTNIAGAVNSSYMLAQADVGHTIKVIVAASNAVGSNSAISAHTNVVNSVGVDAGPAGDFFWKGFNWTKRTEAGSPSYNGKWATANVSGPDSNGYITLHISNPTGSSPISGEFDSTRQGFGYGTYTTVVDTRLDTMNKSLVFGCLFTYDDFTSHASHNEIDVCETSAWGISKNPVTLEHTYYTDAGGGTDIVDAVPIPSTAPLTHRMVWAPGKIAWDSYIGVGTGGQLIRHTERTSSLPVPNKEQLVFNLWAFDQGSATAAPLDVVIRDFSFVPAQ
jgi:hypothetical protein